MNRLVISGAIVLLLGLLGFAIPNFTIQKTEEVARVGDLKLLTTQNSLHIIPPLLSAGAVLLGIMLIGGGLYQKR